MRHREIDLIKGVAVIFMVIFHIYYLGERMNIMSNYTNKNPLYFMGKFAHTVFIICLGINAVYTLQNFEKNNKKKDYYDYYKKIILRASKFASIALLVSFSSYYAFGFDNSVKFGIFHYMTFASIIIALMCNKPLGSMILIILLNILNNIDKSNFNNLNKILGCITGLNMRFSSMDYFPLCKWLPYSLFGVLLGKYIFTTPLFNNSIESDKILQLICTIGSNTIPIYLSHFVIIYIFFKYYS